MSVQDKKSFPSRKGLCFACMRVKHLANACRKRSQCQEGNGSHPTLLHEYKPEGKKPVMDSLVRDASNASATREVVALQTDTDSVEIAHYNSLIIPVKLYSENTGKLISVYALPYNESNLTFITGKTAVAERLKSNHNAGEA